MRKVLGTSIRCFIHTSDVDFARDGVNWDHVYLDTHICSPLIKRCMGCDGNDPAKSTLFQVLEK